MPNDKAPPGSPAQQPLSLRQRIAQRLAAMAGSAPSSAPSLPASPLDSARALIAAVDAGGVPLHPGRVNRIAEGMGLHVDREEPVGATIERIRHWLDRQA